MEEIKEILKFVDLDLMNIPNILTDYLPLNFIPSSTIDDKAHKVFKFVPISKIQILISNSNRLESLKEKYKKGEILSKYLFGDTKENITRHAMFLKMLKTVKKEEIEEIEKEQERYNQKIPFKIKYHNGYLWQVYYEEEIDKYFMIVTMEDNQYGPLFYLIKKQIKFEKTGIDEKIYIPINDENYSKKYLNNIEFADLEKYLWYYTKDWPSIYEVYDNKENLSIRIIGYDTVYENIKSIYSIILNSKDEAIRFYQLVKAIFIMQTELPSYYKFDSKISDNGSLEFYFEDEKIEYNDLAKFIKNEYKKLAEKINETNNKETEKSDNLEKLKEEMEHLEEKYKEKQRKIEEFLECKKTFFGKVKYFIKIKKEIKNSNIIVKSKKKEIKQIKKEEFINYAIEQKEYYTIEDLVAICNYLDKQNQKIKNLVKDYEALDRKIESIKTKIQNSENYLNEITKHNKNIFDFWKFVNKDRVLSLIAVREEKKEETLEEHKKEKSFEYNGDYEELGIEVDKIQRENLSKEECDSIYLLFSDIEKIINEFKENGENIDKNIIEKSLESLKQEIQKQGTIFTIGDFDIFGRFQENRSKLNELDGKRHREIKKSKFKILDIGNNTTKEDYIKKIEQEVKNIDIAINKCKLEQNISLYKAQEEIINEKIYNKFDINPENAIKKLENSENIKLYKINLKSGMNAVFSSNIIYYDNFNKTLPIGMNVTNEVVIDNSKMQMELVQRKSFKICMEDEDNIKLKNINLYEFNVK